MPTLRPSRIGSPQLHEQHLAYQEQAWVAYDVARPSVEVQVMAISEYRARVAAGIALSQPAWRIRVRPAVRSNLQA
ncbi:MAG TPA: hypothetical protein VER11_34220 [Polyangiaceae bacterium]|nr:hypothetical protein [Polyangiaceae bacterium]